MVEIARDDEADRGDQVRRQADDTIDAMATAQTSIFQATFFDGRWLGYADFLLRVESPDRPSVWGPYHYEVADTKLARHVKAGAVLQICSYVEQLTRIQGVAARARCTSSSAEARARRRPCASTTTWPTTGPRSAASRQSVLGTVRAPPPAADLPAAPRPTRSRSSTATSADGRELCRPAAPRRRPPLARGRHYRPAAQGARAPASVETRRAPRRGSPIPFDPPLDGPSAISDRARARAGPHPGRGSRLAKPLSRAAAAEAGRADRARARAWPRSPSPIRATCSSTSRATRTRSTTASTTSSACSTSTSVHGRSGRSTRIEPTEITPGRREGGIRAASSTSSRPATRATRSMHVYHYAPYEPTALKRLMGRHATREEEVDRLLRGGVLVDLFRAVRQGLRASVESYSIKKIEALYGFRRAEIDLRDAGSSIVEFEDGSSSSDVERPGSDILDSIEAYNRDDVLSTAAPARLAGGSSGSHSRSSRDSSCRGRQTARPRRPTAARGRMRAVAARCRRLTEGVPEDATARTDEQHAAMAPRPAALLAPARGEGRVLGLLQSHGLDLRGAHRRQGQRSARSSSSGPVGDPFKPTSRSKFCASAGATDSRPRTHDVGSRTRALRPVAQVPRRAGREVEAWKVQASERDRRQAESVVELICRPEAIPSIPRRSSPLNIFGDKEQRAALLRLGRMGRRERDRRRRRLGAPPATCCSRRPPRCGQADRQPLRAQRRDRARRGPPARRSLWTQGRSPSRGRPGRKDIHRRADDRAAARSRREARRDQRDQPQGHRQLPARGPRGSERESTSAPSRRPRAGRAHIDDPRVDRRRRRTTRCRPALQTGGLQRRRGHAVALGTRWTARASSTSSSWTRPGRCRSPTCWRWPGSADNRRPARRPAAARPAAPGIASARRGPIRPGAPPRRPRRRCRPSVGLFPRAHVAAASRRSPRSRPPPSTRAGSTSRRTPRRAARSSGPSRSVASASA